MFSEKKLVKKSTPKTCFRKASGVALEGSSSAGPVGSLNACIHGSSTSSLRCHPGSTTSGLKATSSTITSDNTSSLTTFHSTIRRSIGSMATDRHGSIPHFLSAAIARTEILLTGILKQHDNVNHKLIISVR